MAIAAETIAAGSDVAVFEADVVGVVAGRLNVVWTDVVIVDCADTFCDTLPMVCVEYTMRGKLSAVSMFVLAVRLMCKIQNASALVLGCPAKCLTFAPSNNCVGPTV